VVEGAGRLLPVGSAGLATALVKQLCVGVVGQLSTGARVEPLPRRALERFLLVCGTASGVTRRQVDALLNRHRGVRRELDPGWLIEGSARDRRRCAAGLLDAWTGGILALTIRPLPPDGPAVTPEQAVAGLAGLAGLASAVIQAARVDGLFPGLLLPGGETADAFLPSSGGEAIGLEQEVLPGLMLGRWMGGVADGLPVVTKAGAFGQEQTLVALYERLSSGAAKVDGTVTAPINKAALNAGGCHYADHTEIYGELTQTADYSMMLAEGDFRVTHVSTHVSLREACDRVKTPRVLKVIKLTHDALRRMDIAEPRIAVAGLNPHCGEGGLFGTEDDEEIAPAVIAACDAGIRAEGPLPADSLFSKLRGGHYDAVVAMYHDQGHIPTKLMGFHYDAGTGTWGQMAGINLTQGLPIVRTSVDHGTAFDKAGEGIANPQSMVEAIRLAASLSRRGTRG